MQTNKLYHYPKCSTCKSAIKFLNLHKIEFESFDISLTPPTENEIKIMLDVYEGDIRKLFNVSGQLYRELDIKNKIADFSLREAVKLLSKNGMLIKRPFLIIANLDGIVGFDEKSWLAKLAKI